MEQYKNIFYLFFLSIRSNLITTKNFFFNYLFETRTFEQLSDNNEKESILLRYYYVNILEFFINTLRYFQSFANIESKLIEISKKKDNSETIIIEKNDNNLYEVIEKINNNFEFEKKLNKKIIMKFLLKNEDNDNNDNDNNDNDNNDNDNNDNDKSKEINLKNIFSKYNKNLVFKHNTVKNIFKFNNN